MLKGFQALSEILQKPKKIFWFCFLFAFLNLVANGSLFQLWSLHREHKELLVKKINVIEKIDKLEAKIHKASDPDFIEQEARNRLDLVGEGDLVFVFSEHE